MVNVAADIVDLTDQQRLVRENVRDICSDFDDEYWRRLDENEEYPEEFVAELGEHGWFGILVPEEYGGAGMGTPEVVVMMEEIAAGGGGFAAAQAIHGGIYNSVPIVRYGSEELKAELLPAIAEGELSIQSLGLTEPNAGSDSTAIETVATERDGEYVLTGQKIWTSRLDATDYLLVVARTTPRAEVEKRTRGISLFLVDVDDALEAGTLEMKPIPKTASNAVHAYEVWLEGVTVPAARLVGERGDGFYHLLDGLNEERLVIAAECLGLGELAVRKGVAYANERVVFDRKIGSNQAIQHPLAKAYAELQAAKALTYGTAATVDETSGVEAGAGANMAKYLAAEAAFAAADAAVQTHGGFGVAREYDVERYLREARLARLVPITQELVLNYLGEKVLGLPRSY